MKRRKISNKVSWQSDKPVPDTNTDVVREHSDKSAFRRRIWSGAVGYDRKKIKK